MKKFLFVGLGIGLSAIATVVAFPVITLIATICGCGLMGGCIVAFICT